MWWHHIVMCWKPALALHQCSAECRWNVVVGLNYLFHYLLWNWCRDDQWFPVSFREDLNCELRHGKRGWRPAWPSIEGVDQRSSHSTAMVGFLYSNSHNVATPFFDIITQRDHKYATPPLWKQFYVFLATAPTGVLTAGTAGLLWKANL